jgi:hypothetical protein
MVGVVVLDVAPPRGISRRRQTSERVGRLAAAIVAGTDAAAARLDLHGALPGAGGVLRLAPDVVEATDASVLGSVGTGCSLIQARGSAAASLRRQVTIGRTVAASAGAAIVDRLVEDGRLVRAGADVRLPGSAAPAASKIDPVVAAAMDRLEAALAVAAPPGLADAARLAGCSSAGVAMLERTGRIVILEPDLAYAASTYDRIEARALALAVVAPLTPAVFRDDTGTSRKYVMAILADLDRRGILRRTADGHVPGPRAAS